MEVVLSNDELVALMRKVQMRVGRMISVERHPNAEKLYVEKVDFGEAEPRTVISGLVPYFKEEEMQGRLCLFVTNLKPAAMRGIVSQAMVLVAHDKNESGKLEFLVPPEGASVGDIVECVPEPAHEAVLPPKKKIFETVQPHLGVSAEGHVTFLTSYPLTVNGSPITLPTIRDAVIS